MPDASRKMIDCSRFPSSTNCTLLIAGKEEEVLRTALRHAVEEHGHEATPEFREKLRSMIVDMPELAHA